MRQHTIATRLPKVFGNNDTLQMCIPKNIGQRANIKAGSHLTMVVIEHEEKILVKKGTVLMTVVDVPGILP